MKQVYSLIQTQESLADELNTLSEIHSYEIQANRSDELENVNTLLMSLGQSPLKSQVTTPLEEQTHGAIRRVVAKLRQAVSASALDLAKGIAPGQDKLLLQLANLHDVTERRPSNSSISSDTLVDEQYLNYLIKMYESCKEKNFPYNEQVRVLTLIPESWNFTNETIQEEFNCTIHAVKTARKLRKITDTPLHIDQKVSKIRQRIDSSKLDYFISWIIHSQLLISIPWGSTNMKLESGQIISIPQQMLQAQQSQIIYSYQQHCKIVGIDTLSDRTLYSILNSLNAREQKFITGINEFVKNASEAWCNLEKIIRQLPISYTIKNDLNVLLEKSKMYLKTKYGCECGETAQTTTHCTIFAMNQPNNPFYSQSCNHDHNMYCEACLSVFVLFDKIEDYINTITDHEMRDEILYDFKMSWDSIFELMGHKIRAAQQEQQYINEIDETAAFLTIDWAQKVLPQQFREGQSFEYGGGVKHLKIGAAEVTDIVPDVSFTSIPELTCIRNIIYQDENFIVRKATGVGLGKPIKYEHISISSNGSDRTLKTFLFCPNELCIKTFESEEELDLHLLADQYTTKESSLRTNDKVKIMLFEKKKNVNISPIVSPPTAINNSSTNIPRHYKSFAVEGWALRKRKKIKPIDKNVKEFIKFIYDEEKHYGRKIPVDEYVHRIRTARNPDSTKRFKTTQYLTPNQVKNQIKMLTTTPKSKLEPSVKRKSTNSPINNTIWYTIKAGDILWSIAQEHGVTVEEILAVNPGLVSENLQVGQQIRLPLHS
ncbi:unnamed protein product [Rotaria sp. Silwood1]|nr:unnamed protein product [Rotaria sp. Silwood1]